MTHHLIQIGVGSILGATGLSHALASPQWARLIGDLARLSYGGLVVGLTSFLTGLGVVLLHNRWEPGLGLLVTLLGWAWLLKGLIYMSSPALLGRVAHGALRAPRRLIWVGWAMAVAGVVLLADGAAGVEAQVPIHR